MGDGFGGETLSNSRESESEKYVNLEVDFQRFGCGQVNGHDC